ncbi:MAG: hypothetical protein HZB46_17920 [Solirubrobacterales bacterium]|nr:hypothetical protein [Solirubrobacterales bacterium]
MRLAAAVAAVTCLAAPTVASASSTVSFSGRTLTITGTAGADKPQVGYRDYGGSQGFTVYDGTGITAGGGCASSGTNEVTCAGAKPTAGNLAFASVTLGGGNDEYSNYADGIADTVDGGDGADKLNGRVAGDSVVPATDHITGGAGNDELSAGSGDGTTCDGGSGDDYIRCFYVTNGVTVTGGPGRDDIGGGDGPDTLGGDGGNDKISGGGGGDAIHGGDGDDELTGDYGEDKAGADDVHGDAGTDTFVEDRNWDRRQFWSLDDVANDGADFSDAGAADEGDNVHSDVENVTGGYDDDTIVGSDGPNKLSGGSLGDARCSGAPATTRWWARAATTSSTPARASTPSRPGAATTSCAPPTAKPTRSAAASAPTSPRSTGSTPSTPRTTATTARP